MQRIGGAPRLSSLSAARAVNGRLTESALLMEFHVIPEGQPVIGIFIMSNSGN